jgi:glycerophosphoryl diester phosphodiesterase
LSAAIHRPLLLAHRGARRAAPENTSRAFDLALAHGCDGFEFDVRACADGNIVCHDPKLDGVEVATSSSQQFRTAAHRGRTTLEQVIERYGSKSFLDIELKVEGLEQAAASAVLSANWPRGYVVSSFLPEVVQRLEAINPSLATGWICDRPTLLSQWSALAKDYFIPHKKLVTQTLINEVHAAGKRLLTWTVNDPGDMRRLADWGVDGIISDETELLCHTMHLRATET